MKTLKIASAGGFGHAKNVFDELALATEFPLVLTGVAPSYGGEDLSGFSAHPWIRRHCPKVYDHLEELLGQARPDVLIVSTRPDQIPGAAMRGLDAGCHLILEKPLAVDFATLRRFHRQAKSSGLRIMAMLSMRTLPAFIQARDMIAEGIIGHPVMVNARKSYKWGTRPDWFKERDFYGGTWPWVGIHALDMADFLTGLRIRRVFAMHRNVGHPGLAGCEDIGWGVFELDEGAGMTVSLDLFRPETARAWGDDWCRVVGTEGVLEANASTGMLRLTDRRHDGVEIPARGPADALYLRFLESVRQGGGGDRIMDPDLPFQLTAAALAARESADRGTAVKIEDFFPCPS